MKFVLELDLSGDLFTDSLPTGMVHGYSVDRKVREVCTRIEDHSMTAGEHGVILDDGNTEKIGSWRIEA